jgi:peroxiredoxin Q/BCP
MAETKDPLEGKKAPAFALEATDGTKIALKDFAGKQPVVLYFYPKDMTSGCTTEACDFRDNGAALKKLGVAVLGVSPDSVKSHGKFTEKEQLNFPLLADVEKKVAEAYGVWVEKSMYGRKYMGIERSTFLIDKDGKIAKAWRKVKVPGHVAEVLAAAKAFGK